MAFQRLRRALIAMAGAALLAACGGGTVVSQFQPTRMVAFGDAFADLGQVGGARYTVNDTSLNIWTTQMAMRYGLTVSAKASGGTSYATGNARVDSNASFLTTTAPPSVASQITTFLGSDAPRSGDLIVVNAGITDIVDEIYRTSQNTQTATEALDRVRRAGTALGDQVRRLVSAGAEHVLVVGPYNLANSPWASQTGQGATLQSYSSAFNTALLVSIVDLGSHVLYVDAPLYINLLATSPGLYGLSNATSLACALADSGPGIGTGTGQVNSALCNTGNLAAGVDPATYLFADRLYLTPVGHRLFGDYAYGRLIARW